MMPMSNASCQRSWVKTSNNFFLPRLFAPETQRVSYPDRPKGLLDVMRPDHVSPSQHRGHRRGQASLQTLPWTEIEKLPDKALARRAHQNRPPQGGERREAAQERQVVIQPFAKTDAGINDNPLRAHTRAQGKTDPTRQKLLHLFHHVLIIGPPLH